MDLGSSEALVVGMLEGRQNDEPFGVEGECGFSFSSPVFFEVSTKWPLRQRCKEGEVGKSKSCKTLVGILT